MGRNYTETPPQPHKPVDLCRQEASHATVPSSSFQKRSITEHIIRPGSEKGQPPPPRSL